MPSLISRMASGSQEQVANHRTQPGSIASIADPRRGGRQCPKGSPGNSEQHYAAIGGDAADIDGAKSQDRGMTTVEIWCADAEAPAFNSRPKR